MTHSLGKTVPTGCIRQPTLLARSGVFLIIAPSPRGAKSAASVTGAKLDLNDMYCVVGSRAASNSTYKYINAGDTFPDANYRRSSARGSFKRRAV
jgi:hypothetical protein